MSILSRSTSCLLAASVTFGVFACIDAPQISGDVAGSSASGDPAGAGAGAGGSGGASAVSRAHDGMVLVPAVTLDVATGVAPTAEAPQGKDGGDNGDGRPPKGGHDGGGAADAGTPATGGGTPAATTTQLAVPQFWIDAIEVTVASYRACLASGSCTAPGAGAGCTLAAGLDAHPVNCVSVDQARAFCTWNDKRLVRNDEWSAAAAGNAHRLYPWGAELPAVDRLNACGAECAARGMFAASDGFVTTAPTGSFPLGRSPDGADDLAGNVAEWVDGTLGSIARGGSYADVDASMVTAASAGSAATPGPTIGFRCAADP
jgi:formylglycine-generating enzyme required for sulfatase activity